MEQRLQSVFKRCARNIALIESERCWRYQQLDTLVTRAAHALQHALPEPLFAFQTASRIEAIVLMLAAIRLGKTFVPLDAEMPLPLRAERLQMLGLNRWVTALALERGALAIGHTPGTVSPTTMPSGVMSIMFTSGSTGRPKGVLVPVSAVRNLLVEPDFMPVREDDVFATYSPLSFDASTFEIFTPLLHGAALLVLDKRLVLDASLLQAQITQHRISVMWMTAGLFNQQVQSGRASALAALRALVVGGDKVSEEAVRAFLHQAAGPALYNGYGPTENTVFTLVAPLRQASAVAIGTPVRGVQCDLFDAQGQRVQGPGEGKLFVSGAGLALGYWDQPALTATAFPAHTAAVSGRYYDTGDWVRRDAAGVYFFLGRDDQQVKLNGHRIELGSIESRGVDGHLVLQVYATLCPQAGGLVLVCLVTQDNETIRRRYRAFLQGVLHAYEQPKHIVFLSHWPLTANGKYDRRALAEYVDASLQNAPSCHGEAPLLTPLIARLLPHVRPDPSGRLFDLGFDSLSLLKLQSAIMVTHQVDLKIMEIYESFTLGGLNKVVQEKIDQKPKLPKC